MLKVEEEVCRSLAKATSSISRKGGFGGKGDRSYQTINHSALCSQLNMSRDHRDFLHN